MPTRPTVPDVLRVLILGLAPTHPDEPGANGGPALVGTHAGRLLAALAGLADAEELAQHYVLRNLWEDSLAAGADLMVGRAAVINTLAGVDPEVTVTLGGGPAQMLGLKKTWFRAQLVTVGRKQYTCHAIPRSTDTDFWADPAHRQSALDLFTRLRGDAPAGM